MIAETKAKDVGVADGYTAPSHLKAFQECFYINEDSKPPVSKCTYCGSEFSCSEEELLRHVTQDSCQSMPTSIKDKVIESVAGLSISRKRLMKDACTAKEKGVKLVRSLSLASLSSVMKDEPWGRQNCKVLSRYVVFASVPFQTMAEQMEVCNPDRFRHHLVDWGKFPDGTDRITIDGFQPRNEIAGEHCIFIASFHNNDVTLSQFSVFIVLLQSFVASLTILLPYYPVGKFQ